MHRCNRSGLGVAAALALLLAAQAACLPARAGDAPAMEPPAARSITDTPGFCATLADDFSREVARREVPVPLTAVSLSEEGRKLCADGQVRAGVNLLRRAMRLLEG